jgi:hypothetical protein
MHKLGITQYYQKLVKMSILGKVFLVKLLIYYNKVNVHMVPLTKETLFKHYNPVDRVEGYQNCL